MSKHITYYAACLFLVIAGGVAVYAWSGADGRYRSNMLNWQLSVAKLPHDRVLVYDIHEKDIGHTVGEDSPVVVAAKVDTGFVILSKYPDAVLADGGEIVSRKLLFTNFSVSRGQGNSYEFRVSFRQMGDDFSSVDLGTSILSQSVENPGEYLLSPYNTVSYDSTCQGFSKAVVSELVGRKVVIHILIFNPNRDLSALDMPNFATRVASGDGAMVIQEVKPDSYIKVNFGIPDEPDDR